jgi:hypothetical protein
MHLSGKKSKIFICHSIQAILLGFRQGSLRPLAASPPRRAPLRYQASNWCCSCCVSKGITICSKLHHIHIIVSLCPHGSCCYLQLMPAGSRTTTFCNAKSFMVVRCEDSHELSARCALYLLLLSSGHFTNLINFVRIITVPRESPWPQGQAERQPYGRV